MVDGDQVMCMVRGRCPLTGYSTNSGRRPRLSRHGFSYGVQRQLALEAASRPCGQLVRFQLPHREPCKTRRGQDQDQEDQADKVKADGYNDDLVKLLNLKINKSSRS